MSRRLAALALALLLVLAAPAAAGAPMGFGSLALDAVAGRAGPGTEHAVLWTYKRKGLPVDVLDAEGPWLKVRDPDGDAAWVPRRAVSLRPTALARLPARLFAEPNVRAETVAVAESGVVLRFERASGAWCAVGQGGLRGWTPCDLLWGPGGATS